MTVSRAVARRSPNVARQRALRRLDELQRGLESPFEALADLYHDQSWRHINDSSGRPYGKFTTFIQDQMSCGASNARRYQQGVISLVLPLRELVAPGIPIPVTSADVARLGVAGARSVVAQARAALRGVPRRDQAEVLRGLLDAVEVARRPDLGGGVKPQPAAGDEQLDRGKQLRSATLGTSELGEQLQLFSPS